MPWTEEALQAQIFETARLTPLEQPLAFQAIYRVLLDREAGPKAGNLLAFLDPAFVLGRFRELPVSRAEFWRESAISYDALERWLAQNKEKTSRIDYATTAELDLFALEVTLTLHDGKRQLRRVILPDATTPPALLSGLATPAGSTIA